MSVAFMNQAKTGQRPPINPVQIQKLLDENAHFIQVISDYQNKGRAGECIQYQQMLHRNLVYLATIADSHPNIQQILPPPILPNPQGQSPAGPQSVPQNQQNMPGMPGPPSGQHNESNSNPQQFQNSPMPHGSPAPNMQSGPNVPHNGVVINGSQPNSGAPNPGQNNVAFTSSQNQNPSQAPQPATSYPRNSAMPMNPGHSAGGGNQHHYRGDYYSSLGGSAYPPASQAPNESSQYPQAQQYGHAPQQSQYPPSGQQNYPQSSMPQSNQMPQHPSGYHGPNQPPSTQGQSGYPPQPAQQPPPGGFMPPNASPAPQQYPPSSNMQSSFNAPPSQPFSRQPPQPPQPSQQQQPPHGQQPPPPQANYPQSYSGPPTQQQSQSGYPVQQPSYVAPPTGNQPNFPTSQSSQPPQQRYSSNYNQSYNGSYRPNPPPQGHMGPPAMPPSSMQGQRYMYDQNQHPNYQPQ
ncbi:SS18-like protein 2 [Nymphon striatum]|nr:SS18-like protein 2 [Nymphon striatum]